MSKPRITVSIDGGEPVPVEAVRVHVEGLAGIEAESEAAGLQHPQLEFNFTPEGLIQELWDDDGVNSGTSSVTYEERATNLYLYG